MPKTLAKLARQSVPSNGILNTVPLLVPVAINAMLSIYDVADAMELRLRFSEDSDTVQNSHLQST